MSLGTSIPTRANMLELTMRPINLIKRNLSDAEEQKKGGKIQKVETLKSRLKIVEKEMWPVGCL